MAPAGAEAASMPPARRLTRRSVVFSLALLSACGLLRGHWFAPDIRQNHASHVVFAEGSFLDGVASMMSAAANVVTAIALVYLATKLPIGMATQSRAAPLRQESRGRLSTAAPLSPTLSPQIRKGSDVEEGFGRQVSVERPDLGNAVELRGGGGKSHVAFTRLDGDAVLIMDSPESIMAMKSVFKRLCTCSKELLSVSDVIKVHSLLGEPVDEEEEKHMTKFFKTSDKAQKSITFETFMDWWSNLHDSSADPDQYYSSERYRQRFKVLQSRLKDPKIANISTITEGDPSSRRFRVFFEASGGDRLSPWHDIPLKNNDASYNFICEIPKWTRKKYEIATGEAMNPIKQDVKNGVLREYKWGDMLFNYGAFPQTWEDPKHVSEETGCPGDNDPIDVIELGTRQRPVGSITRVKIIGVIAMIDDDETDWKVLALAMDDDRSANVNDLNDLDAHMPGVTQSLTHWLRMYKTSEGKPENRFGCDGKPQSAAFAQRIVQECHEAWRQLLAQSNASGKMKKVSSGSNIATDLALDD